MVTHSSTSRPVQCLCMAERTGCPVFTDLWSYVLRTTRQNNMTRCRCYSHYGRTGYVQQVGKHIAQLRYFQDQSTVLSGLHVLAVGALEW